MKKHRMITRDHIVMELCGALINYDEGDTLFDAKSTKQSLIKMERGQMSQLPYRYGSIHLESVIFNNITSFFRGRRSPVSKKLSSGKD